MHRNHVILVTPNDDELGLIDKETAHRYAMLHRAFSVIIYRIRNNHLEILLQRRQLHKYHCGGLWTNSCCSHPLPGETNTAAGEQRLFYEMGIQVPLIQIARFHYVAVLDNAYYENELDYVLVGSYNNDEIPFNIEEVSEVKWITIPYFLQWLSEKPSEFTPWFKQAMDLFLEYARAKQLIT